MIKKLIPYIGKYKKETILAPVTVALEVLIEVYIPFLMSKIIDVGIANADIAYIVKIGLLMVVMAIVSLALGAASGRYAAVASTGFAANLRNALFSKVQDFSFSNIDRYQTASIVTRLTTDVTNTQTTFMMTIRMLVRAPLMMVSAAIMAFSINSELAVIFVLAIPVLGGGLALMMSLAYPRFQKMLKKYDKMNGLVQENLIAMRVVKAFVREKYESERFEDSAETLRRAQIKAERIVIFGMPMMMFVTYACMISVVWFGGHQIVGGTMLSGELMSFISYISQILMSLMMISMVFITMVLTRASISRISEILDEVPDISDRDAKEGLSPEDGSVEFEHVSFSYVGDRENPTLCDINLSIHSGETIGVIGGTGSAKTALVQLIPRLYDVLSGSVRVGGHDVREYKIKALRDEVAMVLQKNVLFSGTIRENLKWGDLDASDEEIFEACRAAQADEFIRSFPNGYDTDLGQGGVNLSGGQKQRLCIARALLKKPKIIILDDSTSAVDTATDAKIRKAFSQQLGGTTAIIIAQRIASVMDADRIVVMHDGKINAVGTHEELLAGNQIYREVYESQLKGVA